MTTTLLLSEAKLRAFSDINNNVDSELLKNAIREAGDLHAQRIIGTKLYQKLIADVDADNVTGEYLTLLTGYLQDFLLYAAYYESLEYIYLRVKNNGLLTPTGGENSVQVDRNVYEMKRQSVKNKMEYYAERLTNYLIEKVNVFPELNENAFLYEQNPDYNTQFRGPIVFREGVDRVKWAKKAGLRITDSKYSQYPWGSDIK